MEDSFVYEAKGPTLIIHLPKEFDHHNCRICVMRQIF